MNSYLFHDLFHDLTQDLTAAYCFSVVARTLLFLHVAAAARFELVAALVIRPLDVPVSRDVGKGLRGSACVLLPQLKNMYIIDEGEMDEKAYVCLSLTNFPSQFWAPSQFSPLALFSAVQAGLSKMLDPVISLRSLYVASVCHMARPNPCLSQ